MGMDTDADITHSRHRGVTHPLPGDRPRTSSDRPHRVASAPSAVAADPEDDVLPGRNACSRVRVLAVRAGAGSEDDGVVVGNLVQEGLEGPLVVGRAVGGVHVADELAVVVTQQVRRKDLRGDRVVDDGIVGGVADDAPRPRAVSGHRSPGGDVGDDAHEPGALGEVHRGRVERRDRARGQVEGPAGQPGLLPGPPRTGDLPGAVLGAVGVPDHGLDVGVDQPEPVAHELLQDPAGGALAQPETGATGLPGEAPPLSRTRASRACSPTRSRSWITGWANRMIRSTRVPEAAATCSGVSPARIRAWMTRGGSSGPWSPPIWGSRRESPRAAARPRASTGSRNRSPSAPSAPWVARMRFFPSSESATRRSERMGRPPDSGNRSSARLTGTRGYRRAGNGARRLPGVARPRTPLLPRARGADGILLRRYPTMSHVRNAGPAQW